MLTGTTDAKAAAASVARTSRDRLHQIAGEFGENCPCKVGRRGD